MREIKFRLVLNNQIVGYEWHKPLTMRDGHIDIFHSIDNEEWFNTRLLPDKYIKHDHKEQFTGRYDQNEKEKYENDWIKNTEPDMGGGRRYYSISLIVFNKCMFMVNIDGEDVLLSDLIGDTEVIGNIHKNPEMPEEK